MTVVLSVAIVVGILNCIRTISNTRVGIIPAAKPKQDRLINFNFLNE